MGPGFYQTSGGGGDIQYWVSRGDLDSLNFRIFSTGSADGPWILSNCSIFSIGSADGPWILSNFRIFSTGSADEPYILSNFWIFSTRSADGPWIRLTSGYSVLGQQMGPGFYQTSGGGDIQYWVSLGALDSLNFRIFSTGSADGPWILSNFWIFRTGSSDGP